jgi:hypothetical protein
MSVRVSVILAAILMGAGIIALAVSIHQRKSPVEAPIDNASVNSGGQADRPRSSAAGSQPSAPSAFPEFSPSLTIVGSGPRPTHSNPPAGDPTVFPQIPDSPGHH